VGLATLDTGRRTVIRAHYILTALAFPTILAAQTQLSDENAYNPVPSPDGKKIAAVRTGWHRPGGSSGFGRSNLVSEIILLDREGHILSSKPPADGFVADWTKAGIVVFRDWSYALVSEDGSIVQKGRVCPGRSVSEAPPTCAERVAYLSTINSFVWVFEKFDDSVLMTPRGDLSSHHHEGFLGDSLAPSPDERYIAAGPVHLSRSLHIYDLREKAWIELGTATIHPDPDWNFMEPSWSPWFADSSQLTFFDTDGLVVSSPDGHQRRVVLRAEEPAGLAAPSPDGRRIAYATFTSRPRTAGPRNQPIWSCSGIWVVGLQATSQPRRLVGPASDLTYDLRWLDNEHLVFDRIDTATLISPKARIWIVDVPR